jgi:hypothetical protein
VRRAALFLLSAAALLAPGTAFAQASRQAVVFVVEGLTPDAAMSDAVIGSLVRAGGIGLLASPRDPRLDLNRLSVLARQRSAVLTTRSVAPSDAGPAVRSALEEGGPGDVLVVVIGSPHDPAGADMVIVAEGPPGDLLAGLGRPHGLTSDTTRQAGVVADVDVPATILDFLGLPGEPVGSEIRIEGPAPTDLFDRAVDHGRIVEPLSLVVLAVGLGSLVVGVGILILRVRSRTARSGVAVIGLFSVAAWVALIPASILPSLEPQVLLPGVLLMGGLLTAAALLAGRADHTMAVVVVAGAGLAILAIDGLLGWPTEVTPLLGGGAVLGVRFYGLGNSASGIVLAGAVLVAARLGPWSGVGLLVATALFAGLPFLGSDLGGGVTLFTAAGLWYGWRVRGRLDPVAAGVVAAAGLIGAAVLVSAHTLWPSTTHVARAVEAGGVAGTFVDRLFSNIRATTAIWPVWLTVIGLPVWGLVAGRMMGPFQPVLAGDPPWRVGAIVLAIGGMIGYVLNDSYGMAAVAFAFLSAAMIYPALRWTSA